MLPLTLAFLGSLLFWIVVEFLWYIQGDWNDTYTDENGVVLDCFAGSGTTLVAAKTLNRQFIGLEKEKEFYDICLERLK